MGHIHAELSPNSRQSSSIASLEGLGVVSEAEVVYLVHSYLLKTLFLRFGDVVCRGYVPNDTFGHIVNESHLHAPGIPSESGRG